jgi:hypothetical protein
MSFPLGNVVRKPRYNPRLATREVHKQARGPEERRVPNAGTRDCLRLPFQRLRSPCESENVSFHKFSLPEDQYLRLLKEITTRKPKTEIRELLGDLHSYVQAIMQLRWMRREQDAEKDRT